MRRRAAWALLAIVAGALLAYHNSFTVPFLFDDDSSIKDNPTIRSLLRAWWPPQENGVTVSGRPLLNFTLALNYAVSGPAVWSYHAVNLLIHALAGCVLFGVVRRTLWRLPGRSLPQDSLTVACFTALIWTLHPLQTESVTYIVQRAESLVSLCYLLTLWCFIRSVEPGAARGWSWLTFLACLCGMAAKEVMVTAPVMVALYDRTFVTASWREVWEKHGRRHLALAGTWLLLAGLVVATGNRGGTAGFGTSVLPLAYAVTQVAAVVHYLRLAVWPQPLIFDYGQWLAGGISEVWWQALVLAPLLTASVVALMRGRAAGYCGVFFFGVLAPSSSFVPVATQTMNEHRMYLPLAALVTLFVGGLYAALGRKSWIVLAVVALALALTTVRRNGDYQSNFRIWEDTVAKRPASARANATLGMLYERDGRLPEARALLERAIQLNPVYPEAHNNLGDVWVKLEQPEQAIRCFQASLALKPDQPTVMNNLGNTLLLAGRVPEAIAQLEAAVRLKPDLDSTRFNLANTLAQSGRLAEAASHYEKYLAAQPADAEARSNYSTALLMLGRRDEAITQLETAVKLRPGSAEIHNNLGVALAQAGRLPEALQHFQEAVRLDPNFTRARENAARAQRTLPGG
jgi:tetratricopeptide (TPR) repeat protein